MNESRSVFITRPVNKDRLIPPKHDSEEKKRKHDNIISQIIIKQIEKILPFYISYPFISDTNLIEIDNSLILTIISSLFYIEVVLFSFFFDFNDIWSYNDNLKKASNIIASIFHCPIDVSPSQLFNMPFFYISSIIFLISLFVYITLIVFQIKKFIHSIFWKIMMVISEALTFAFLLHNIVLIPFQLVLFSRSNDLYKILLIIAPIYAILSLFANIILVIRSLADIRLNCLPFSATYPTIAFKQVMVMIVSISIEPFFSLSDGRSVFFKLTLYVLFISLSIYNLSENWKYPPFLNPFTQVWFFSACLLLPLNLTAAFIFSFFKNSGSANVFYIDIELPDYLPLIVMIIFNILCPIISIANLHYKRKKAKSLILTHLDHTITELTKDEMLACYAYHTSATYGFLSSLNCYHDIIDHHKYSDELILLALRFLYSTKANGDQVFTLSESLFSSSSSSNILIQLQYALLVELSNEQNINNKIETSIRLQRIEAMLDECIDAHILFWRSILFENPLSTSESAVNLYQKLINTEHYFQYMKINANSPPSYLRRYQFYQNILVANTYDINIETSDNIFIDPVSPSTTQEQLQNPKTIISGSASSNSLKLLRDNFSIYRSQPYINISKNHSTGKLHKFKNLFDKSPPLVAHPFNRYDLAPERKSLFYNTNHFYLKGQKFRIYFLGIIFLIGFILYISISIWWIFQYAILMDFPKITQSFLSLESSIFLSSFHVMRSFLNSDFHYDDYFLPFNITDNTSEINLTELLSYNYQNALSAVYDLGIDQSLLNSTYSNLNEASKLTFSSLFELIESEIIYNCTSSITKLGSLIINESFNTVGSILERSDIIHKSSQTLLKILVIFSACLFIIMIILEIREYISVNNIFWQPIIIPKVSIKKIYDYFVVASKTTSKRKNKIKKARQVKEFANIQFSSLILPIIKIFALFLIQFVLSCLTTILASNFSDKYITNLRTSLNSGVSYIPFFVSIFQILPLSRETNIPFWLVDYMITNFQLVSRLIDMSDTSYLFGNGHLIIPDHILTIGNFSIYKLTNRTLVSNFLTSLNIEHSFLMRTLKLLTEARGASYSSLQIFQWISFGQSFSRFHKMIDVKFRFNFTGLRLFFIFLHIIILILHIIILFFAIQSLKSKVSMVRLITRMLTLMPENSPFVDRETNQVRYLDHKTKEDLMPFLDLFPFSFITVDSKNQIIQMNSGAIDMFGNIKGRKYFPKDSYVDSNGTSHSLSILFTSLKNFPYHPFSNKFKGSNYYILQDISSMKKAKHTIGILNKELKELRRYLLTPSIAIISNQDESIITFEKFAIVEISFQENVNYEDFLSFKNEMSTVSDKIPTAFVLDQMRNSFFVIFSSFNQQLMKRQHMRDALSYTKTAYSALKIIGIDQQSKICVSQGRKSFIKITDSSKRKTLELFSSVLIKNSYLLSFADYGEIIFDYEIIRSSFDLSAVPFKYGNFTFEDREVECRIIQNKYIMQANC